MREKFLARSNLVGGVFLGGSANFGPTCHVFFLLDNVLMARLGRAGRLCHDWLFLTQVDTQDRNEPLSFIPDQRKELRILFWKSSLNFLCYNAVIVNFDCLDFPTMFWQRSFATNKVWVVLLVRVSFPKGKRVFCLDQVPTTSWLWWQKAGSTLKNQAILVFHSVAVGDDSWPKYASESWSLAVTGQNYK